MSGLADNTESESPKHEDRKAADHSAVTKSYEPKVVPGLRASADERECGDESTEADPQAILAKRLSQLSTSAMPNRSPEVASKRNLDDIDSKESPARQPPRTKSGSKMVATSRASSDEEESEETSPELDNSASKKKFNRAKSGDESDEEPAGIRTPSKKPRHVSKTAGGRHVLLVEDVRVSQRVAKVALTKAKFKVDVCGDGIEAVKKFKQSVQSNHPYDLILMDIMLPKMNGCDATVQIRELEQKEGHKRTVVFGLTGNLSDEDLENYKRVDMDGVIAKGNILCSAVEEAIEKHDATPDEFIIAKLEVAKRVR